MLWDEEFERTLRSVLRFLSPDQALEPDAALVRLGLDSLETVGLLMTLESAYGISFPDESLSAQTFQTPASLWAVVRGLAEARQ